MARTKRSARKSAGGSYTSKRSRQTKESETLDVWIYGMLRCTDVDGVLRVSPCWTAENVAEIVMQEDAYELFGRNNHSDATIHLMVGRERRGDQRQDVYILMGMQLSEDEVDKMAFNVHIAQCIDRVLCHDDDTMNITEDNVRFMRDADEVRWSMSIIQDMQDVYEIGHIEDVIFE